MLTISKDRSTQIKGIVIVMMIFLHLFNGNHTDLCINLLYIGDVPLAKWLSNACNPVDFFLLLSGYGLAYTYEKRRLYVLSQLKRIIKLYVHYWVILALFLSIGFYIHPTLYPGNINKLMLNAIGWESTYNAEMWFLFPYCLISLASPLIMRGINRLGNKQALLITAGVHVATCFFISRYGEEYLYGNMLLYNPLLFFHLLYAFTTGVCLYQCGTELNGKLSSIQTIVLILLLVAIVATFGNSVAYMIYVPLMIFLFCQISYPTWLENILMELGRKSMAMWMIHTWFCYYLFQPQIYSLRYPIVILGGAILLSYITAIPVMWIAQKINRILKL